MKYEKLAKLLCIMLIITVLAGCSNTLEGIGRDVEHAGEKIQDTF